MYISDDKNKVVITLTSDDDLEEILTISEYEQLGYEPLDQPEQKLPVNEDAELQHYERIEAYWSSLRNFVKMSGKYAQAYKFRRNMKAINEDAETGVLSEQDSVEKLNRINQFYPGFGSIRQVQKLRTSCVNQLHTLNYWAGLIGLPIIEDFDTTISVFCGLSTKDRQKIYRKIDKQSAELAVMPLDELIRNVIT